MEFSGRLTSVSLSDLLQWTSNDRRTGTLVFRTGSRRKEVHFDEGQVVGASTDDPREYFGQFLLLEGYLAEDQLMEALTWCREHESRLGASLVAMGFLSEEETQHALRRQIEDTVCDLFLWDRGVFYFAEHLPREETLLPQPIHTVALAMEGARWRDEHDRIRRVFVHDQVALRPGPSWPGETGDPRQNRILSSMEEEGITLEELYERVKGSEFRFLASAFDLTVREVLDIASVGEEDGGRSSVELKIFDLLMDQAAQEEVLFSQRHLALPIDVLDRCYPVWMEFQEGREPPSPEVLAFCRRMDGTKSLRRLVLEDGGDRERRMETILLELRSGNLALLPRPVAEIEAAGRKGWLGWLKGLVGE